MDLTHAISELRRHNEPVPRPRRLPSDEEVGDAERALGLVFPLDYRRYLLEASDVSFGTLEPCVVVPGAGALGLVQTAERAWRSGVSARLLPICEDNGDYYCLDDSIVVYWSHDGVTDESWPDLASWILDVWIGENA